MRRIYALVISLFVLCPLIASSQVVIDAVEGDWIEKDAKAVTRLPDKAFAYYRSPDGQTELRAEITMGSYRALPHVDGEPLPRDASIPAEYTWIGAAIGAQFSTPSGDLKEGDIADDGTDIWVVTPDGMRGLDSKDFTVSENAGKVNITPDPPDFRVTDGKLNPKEKGVD